MTNGPSMERELPMHLSTPEILDPELPEIRVQRSMEINGKSWAVRISRLCPSRSITIGLDNDFLCDAHDLRENPLCYRLHMYPGGTRGPDVPFQVKLERMQTWQQAILMFARLMSSEIKTDSMEELARALRDFQVPQADMAVLDTGNNSLRRLFEC